MKKQNVKIEFDGKLYDRDLIVSYMRTICARSCTASGRTKKAASRNFLKPTANCFTTKLGKNLKSKAETGINARPRETASTC